MASSTVRWMIQGRVQGVGFRYFVSNAARDCGVEDGSVRNLRDGRVEVVARGESVELARFEVCLRKGPTASRIDDLTREVVSIEIPSGFHVAE